MVLAQVSDEYFHFVLIFMTDYIFPVLPIKNLINKDGDPAATHKMETGTKPSLSNLLVLFYPCVVPNTTARVYKKA